MTMRAINPIGSRELRSCLQVHWSKRRDQRKQNDGVANESSRHMFNMSKIYFLSNRNSLNS